MANSYFRFKQFTIHQDRCAMKVTTDACVFGAWVASSLAQQLKEVGGELRMLDLGTGTGLLSLMIAQQTSCKIDALELDADACSQAEENFSSSPWAERLQAIQGDAVSYHSAEAYDFIVSNPPFYEKELRSPDEKRNLAHHGGISLRQVLEALERNLKPEGRIYLLFPVKRAEEMAKALQSAGWEIYDWVELRPSVRQEAFRLMLSAGRKKEARHHFSRQEISIRVQSDQYSPEAVALLRHYYLYLE